jgi:hypothetical protein
MILWMTMLFLAFGYYFGGKVSTNKEPKALLKIVTAFGVLVYLIALALAEPLMHELFSAGFIPVAILSSILLIGPGILLFSMINPIIIQVANADVNTTGAATGSVFAILSISGVLMALLVVLYLLPAFG